MKTIHIAHGNPDPSQDGSVFWPYRVHTEVQFDEIFRRYREPTVFLLGPGEYRTRGCWAFDQHAHALLGPNSHLIGTHGSNATFLRLDDDYTKPPAGNAVEVLIGGGFKTSGSNQMVVSGLTIDASVAEESSCGVHLYSGGCAIEDLRVIGVTGAWGGAEGFGILINGSVDARNGGSRVRGCRVEFSTDRTYYNGIYLGSVTSGEAPNVIENCYVAASVQSGVRRSHTAFAANENTRVVNCVGQGFERFLFCDTGNVGDLEITGCRGDFGYCAIDLPAPASPQNKIDYRRRIRVTDCSFTNSNPTADHAIFLLIQDKTADNRAVKIEDIDVDGCRASTSLQGDKFFVLSIQGLLTERVWVRNSQFPSGSQTRNGVYPPTPQASVRIDDVPD